MGVVIRVDAGEVLVRHVGVSSWIGSAAATIGGLALVSSVVADLTGGHWAWAGAMLAIGVLWVHGVLACTTGSVIAHRDGLHVRSGLIRRRIAVSDITQIRVSRPTFQSYVVLVIETTGRPRKVRAIRDICTAKNRRRFDKAETELAATVGLSV